MKKFIISLVRRYLGLKKYEGFKFVNQKSDDIYYFGDDGVYKAYTDLIMADRSKNLM